MGGQCCRGHEALWRAQRRRRAEGFVERRRGLDRMEGVVLERNLDPFVVVGAY